MTQTNISTTRKHGRREQAAGHQGERKWGWRGGWGSPRGEEGGDGGEAGGRRGERKGGMGGRLGVAKGRGRGDEGEAGGRQGERKRGMEVGRLRSADVSLYIYIQDG